MKQIFSDPCFASTGTIFNNAQRIPLPTEEQNLLLLGVEPMSSLLQ